MTPASHTLKVLFPFDTLKVDRPSEAAYAGGGVHFLALRVKFLGMGYTYTTPQMAYKSYIKTFYGSIWIYRTYK